MAFVYSRVIRFHETDAAGVVYFANVLTLCHEAYEAALGAAGIDLKTFFSAAGGVAVPITHAEVDFARPLFCGDAIAIILTPKTLDAHRFEITYELVYEAAQEPSSVVNPDSSASTAGSQLQPLARALTQHVCINTQTRRRHPVTAELVDWIAALTDAEVSSG